MIDVTDYKTLTDDALFDQLFTAADALPRAAADEIVARGDRLSGRLLELLGNEAEFEDDTDRGWSVVHAVLLVGTLKPPSSLQRLLGAVRLSLEFDVEAVLHYLPAILASFGPGATPELIAHLDSFSESPYGLKTLANALDLIGRRHKEMRPSIAAALRRVCADEQRGREVRSLVAECLLDFAEASDRPLLEELAGSVYPAEAIDDALNGIDLGDPVGGSTWMDFYNPDQIAARQERWDKYVDEVCDSEHDECDCGHHHNHDCDHNHDHDCDHDHDHGAFSTGAGESSAFGLSAHAQGHQPPPPPLRREQVPGRNDPCTCGSGKKYKKCCGK